jgi:phosphatidylglycerol:prolipoprotein diacylglycerol transferase
MYPLLELGLLNLATGGLTLLLAAYWWSQRFERRAAHPAAADAAIAALVAAVLVGRLAFGLTHWSLYGADPALFLALRIAEFWWPAAYGAALLAIVLVARWRGAAPAALLDAAALALPWPQALASLGLLLSGDAPGQPTSLPWAVPMLGALRHPLGAYLALSALALAAALGWLARRQPPPGRLAAVATFGQGVLLLLWEPLNAAALTTVAGVHVVQLAGLGLIIGAMLALRPTTRPLADATGS